MKEQKEPNIVFAGDYEYVPEKTYQASATHYDRASFYQRRKLYLWFQIIDGPHRGKKIFMPFNLHTKIRRGSKYYGAWLIANNGIKPKPNNRMSPKLFMSKVFKIKTRTVLSGRKKESLTDGDRYSVVEEILELCAG